VRTLLAANADANARDVNGLSMLYVAAGLGFYDITELLLEYKADANLGTTNTTPLHSATKNGNLDICKLLLAFGADPLISCVKIGTMLDIIFTTDTLGKMKQALTDLVLNHLAHEYASNKDARKRIVSHIETMSELHDKTLKNKFFTLLTKAASLSALNAKLALLDSEEDINSQASGETLLYYFAAIGNVAGVERALKYGADVNLGHAKTKATPLMIAAQNGRFNVCRILLKNYADPDLVIHGDTTAIHHAARYGEFSIVGQLLNSGANPFITEACGRKILDILAHETNGKYTAIEKLIRLHKNSPDNRLLEAATRNEPENILLALQAGAIINSNEYDNNGYTPLAKAATAGHVSVVETLLEYKADPNLPNKNKPFDCPLGIAAEGGHVEICQLLLAHGAKHNYLNALNGSPLYYAAQSGSVAICRMLLDLNADPMIMCRDGDSPFLFIFRHNDLDKANAIGILLLDHIAAGIKNKKIVLTNDDTIRLQRILQLAAKKSMPEIVARLLKIGITHPDIAIGIKQEEVKQKKPLMFDAIVFLMERQVPNDIIISLLPEKFSEFYDSNIKNAIYDYIVKANSVAECEKCLSDKNHPFYVILHKPRILSVSENSGTLKKIRVLRDKLSLVEVAKPAPLEISLPVGQPLTQENAAIDDMTPPPSYAEAISQSAPPSYAEVSSQPAPYQHVYPRFGEDGSLILPDLPDMNPEQPPPSYAEAMRLKLSIQTVDDYFELTEVEHSITSSLTEMAPTPLAMIPARLFTPERAPALPPAPVVAARAATQQVEKSTTTTPTKRIAVLDQ
jgi:ankyrin repeat protein